MQESIVARQLIMTTAHQNSITNYNMYSTLAMDKIDSDLCNVYEHT